MNSDPIALLESKTFWSTVVTMGLMAAKLMGHDTSKIDAVSMTDHIVSFITTVGPFVSSIAAIYFRTTTTAPITGIVKPK